MEMKILFLDLDGTVRYSKNSEFINDRDDVAVFPEAAEQAQRFQRAGWYIAYVSNQGGIAYGFTTQAQFRQGVERTEQLLGIIFDGGGVCPHYPSANCICRKPRPGLPTKLIADLPWEVNNMGDIVPVDTTKCLFVGDRPEDQGCAEACGIPFMSAEDWRAGKATP